MQKSIIIAILILTISSISTFLIHTYSGYTVKMIDKKDIPNIASFISELRIQFFRDYPYLYEGSMEEAMDYLDWFSKLKDTQIAVAYLKDRPVGFLAGTAFINFDEHFKGSAALFKNAGLDPEEFYYFSEIIILPEHRGKHISTKLFKRLENYAAYNGYKSICFVNESHVFHPLKPADYKPLDAYFLHLGYQCSSLMTHYSWPTAQLDGSISNQEHSLRFWIKILLPS